MAYGHEKDWNGETKQTKTVQGYFGKDMQITREDFITRWLRHLQDCYSLAKTKEDYDEVVAMATKIEAMAWRKWDGIKSSSNN